MLRILIVEDNIELIEELAELIVLEKPDTKIDFAVDIPTALARLNKNPFDIVILDVMLPTYPGVPSRDEGLYLAAWILGKTAKLPDSMKRHKRPDCPTPRVVFLTLRAKAGVQNTWNELSSDAEVPTCIERFLGNAYEHYKIIATIIDEPATGH